jgi:hypothetical protein
MTSSSRDGGILFGNFYFFAKEDVLLVFSLRLSFNFLCSMFTKYAI